MIDGLGSLFDTTGFPQRWHCGAWTAGHGWVHIVSDAAIWAAYMTIPAALVYFVLRRKDLPFPGIFWLFGLFIVSCGTGHLVEAGMFWWPAYRLSAAIKVVTALASWGTVIALLPVLPKALSFPGMARVNEELQREVAERKRVEEVLRERAREVARFNRLTVGREQRMIDLKREVNRLSVELGRTPPFDLSFLDRATDAEAG